MEKEEEFHDSAVRCLFDGKQFFFSSPAIGF